MPIIRPSNSNMDTCPECGNKIKYFAADLRPVFPQERLLMEIVKKTPLKYINSSVWCANNDRAAFLARIYMPEESTKWRDFLVDFAKKSENPMQKYMLILENGKLGKVAMV